MHPSHLIPPESSEKFLARLHRQRCQGIDEDGELCVICFFYSEVTAISVYENQNPSGERPEIEGQ